MIDATIARLRAEVPALKLVGGAADFQTAVERNPTVTPAAFVFPLEESPGENQMGNVVIQRVVAGVGIAFVVKNVSDVTGDAARQDLIELRQAVKERLLGWSPAAGHDPYERGNSGLLAFRDGHMWWQDVYRTAYFDRSIL